MTTDIFRSHCVKMHLNYNGKWKVLSSKSEVTISLSLILRYVFNPLVNNKNKLVKAMKYCEYQ